MVVLLHSEDAEERVEETSEVATHNRLHGIRRWRAETPSRGLLETSGRLVRRLGRRLKALTLANLLVLRGGQGVELAAPEHPLRATNELSGVLEVVDDVITGRRT